MSKREGLKIKRIGQSAGKSQIEKPSETTSSEGTLKRVEMVG